MSTIVTASRLFTGFALCVVLSLSAGCASKTGASPPDSTRKAQMKQLADFLEHVRPDDVGEVSLTFSNGTPIATSRNLNAASWNRCREILADYLRRCDVAALGAVQPTHKIVVRLSLVELHINLFTVLDRQGTKELSHVEALKSILAEKKRNR